MPGAFSEEAARAMLGNDVRLLPCRTLEDEFRAVASGRVRSAVVPITNTVAGAIPGCAEIVRRQSHDAAAIASTRAAGIWGGVVLEDKIQDRPDNLMRFGRIQNLSRFLTNFGSAW